VSAPRRLLSNTVLSFIGTIVLKASSSLLFILIGRRLGPDEAGIYNLAVTAYTVVFALSAWGLHELLVREVAPRRDESNRYLVNYVVLRTLLAAAGYGLLLLALRWLLPYSIEANRAILILSLAIFPDAISGLCAALFIAHEQLRVPTVASLADGAGTLAIGAAILLAGGTAVDVAWAVPVGATIGLLVYLPALARLLRRVPQRLPGRLDFRFWREQLRFTPGFITIGLFSTLDFQTDTFLISILLSEADLGLYGAAQTVMLAFWMMPVAIRTALYPMMSRTFREAPEKLPRIYHLTGRYLILLALPMAAGVSLLAEPILELIFGPSFLPAAPLLRVMIWAIVPAFLLVPNARLMLVHNRQQQLGWLTGLSMALNIGLNLWLIPRYGIVGAGWSRVLATLLYFLGVYILVQTKLLRDNWLALSWRPLLATALMAVVVWWLRDAWLPLTIVAGAAVYAAALVALGGFPREEWQRMRQLVGW
jgi:O-antigen/teichoic acid export membrane protein